MNLFKIVLTGGPCAGKTDVLNALKEYYKENKEICLLTINETATELIESGIRPQTSIDFFSFQNIVFSRQLNKEETSLEFRNKDCDNLKNIIIYDRALNDNKAYIDQMQYDKILNRFNKSEIDILNDYDLVIDLVSTAGSKIAKYDMISNKSRYEKEEEAEILDKRTTNAWVGHRNLKIIKPTKTIEDKINQVKEHIDNLINFENYKVKKRYVVEPVNFSIYNDENSKTFDVEKIYLNYRKSNNYKYIITKTTYKDNSCYSLSLESNKEEVNKTIYDVAIDKEKALELLKEFAVIKKINKRVINFIYDYHKCSLNIYDDVNILEVEAYDIFDDVKIPGNLNVLSSINHDYDSTIECSKVKKKTLAYDYWR